MSGPADKGFGAHPFGEIARATVAAQEVNHPTWVMPGGLGPGIVDP
jgi:hypothetical protein